MDRDRPSGGRTGTDRRRFLAALGTAAASAVAGCSVSSEDPAGGRSGDEDDGEPTPRESPDDREDGRDTDGESEWTPTVDRTYPGWSQFKYDLRNTGHNRDATGPAGDVAVDWKTEVGQDARTPVVVDGVAYVLATGTGGVYALDADTGETLWTHEDERLAYDPPEDAINIWKDSTTPAVSGEHVYVSGQKEVGGTLLALDRETGEKRWEFATDLLPTSPVVGPPDSVGNSSSGVGETVYIAAASYLFAVDPDGNRKWGEEMETRTPPAIVDGRIYVNSNEGLQALDPETGEVVWTGEARGNTSPTIVNGRVFVSAMMGVWAYEATGEGGPVWESRGYERQSSWGPVVAHGNVYVHDRGFPDSEGENTLYALDAATGEENWTSSRRPGGRPAAADDALYCYDYARDGVVAVDPADGTDRWRFEVGADVPTDSSLVVDDGVVYVGANDGLEGNDHVYALGGSG